MTNYLKIGLKHLLAGLIACIPAGLIGGIAFLISMWFFSSIFGVAIGYIISLIITIAIGTYIWGYILNKLWKWN